MAVALGAIVRDRVSGIKGVVLGRAEYAYMPPQLMVVPREAKDGKPCEAVWLEEKRCEALPDEFLIGFRSDEEPVQ